MLKFIKMKHHYAYLLYNSVLFVVVVFTVIENFFCELKSEMKRIEYSSGKHFFMFEIFDLRRWKLRQESHASKRNDNQLDFGTAF